MLDKVIAKIKKNKTFLITAHMNLEGDALGSELAAYLLLKKLKKKVTIYNNDPTPQIYTFLPSSSVIRNKLNGERFDVSMFLDCSDSSRAGKVTDALSHSDCIVNIDHHISNTFFGDINWVEPWAGSTCQMLYHLCQKMKIMDKNIALCLYTGIFTDTGNFTYANTDQETHRIVTDLMRYRISPHRIYENLHSLCDERDLDFMGKILSSLQLDAHKKVCWATIKRWQDRTYDLTEVIFNMMRLLKGVEVFLLFKRVGRGRVRVNFRSRSKVDVNRIAQFFGGGGHKRASGTTMPGTLHEVEKKVVSFVKRYTNAIQNASRNSSNKSNSAK